MKIKQAIEKIITTFQTGNIPKAIAYSINPLSDVPLANWSFFNRLIAFLNGTHDARGFRQWMEVGRNIKKGAKSFQILAPRFKNVESDEDETTKRLVGYVPINVFRIQDTAGQEIEYEEIELPKFPLIEVAQEFNISVNAIPGNAHFYGCYYGGDNSISLATPEESVFFHELAHAADYRVRELKPKHGQQTDREIIAELSACALGYLIGKKLPTSLGNHFEYIEHYANKEGCSVLNACMKYMHQVEAVIKEILKYANIQELEVTA